MSTEDRSEALDAKYWDDIKAQGPLAGITLDAGISPEDFRVYGDRLAQRQLDIVNRFAQPDFASGTIVDVGCGMGRITRPFAHRFKKVIALDINTDILEQARTYCAGLDNIEYLAGDGMTIPLPDASVDFVYSGGVLQHIPDLDVILNYFREGIRVLRPGGILNYSFQIWYTSRQGGVDGNRVGAQILASDLTRMMKGQPCIPMGLVEDPKDPVPHMNIVIQRTDGPVRPWRQRLRRRKVVAMPVRTGIFEDLESYEDFRRRWAKKDGRKPVTFWD